MSYNLSVAKTDLTSPDTPFLIESGVRYMQTKALNQHDEEYI